MRARNQAPIQETQSGIYSESCPCKPANNLARVPQSWWNTLPFILIPSKPQFCHHTTTTTLVVGAHVALKWHPTDAKNVSTLKCSAAPASSPPTSSFHFIISGNGVVCTSSIHHYLHLVPCFVWDIKVRSAETISLDLGVTPWSLIPTESTTFILNIVAVRMYQRPFSLLGPSCFLPQWKDLRPLSPLWSSMIFICTAWPWRNWPWIM